MTTATSVHAQIRAALVGAGVTALYGPARKADVPVNADGAVGQFAVLWPSPGLHQYTRTSGTRSGREDRVTVLCVGASSFDALAVADAVEAAVGGLVTSSGSPLRQTVSTAPAPEPNADPVRVSMAVEYSTITKG